MPETKKISEKTFEKIKHHTEGGLEFWYARELQEALEYAKWGNFVKIIDKAKQAMKDDKIKASEHITEFSKKSSDKDMDDMILSRTSCLYIAQSSDKRKKAVAVAQEYFAAAASIPSAPKPAKQAAQPKVTKQVEQPKAPVKKAVVVKKEAPKPAVQEKKSLARSRQLKKVAKQMKKS